MDSLTPSLKDGDHGPYATLASRPLPAGRAVVFMPSLAALLEQAENLKGAPITEEQVIRIRDAALAVVVPSEVVAATVEKRGYAEVDPANVWKSWQAIRSSNRPSPTRPMN